MDDEYYMRQALAEARAAFEAGEVPVGAVVVADATGRIIGRGHNMTEALGDVTAHAEMLAVTAAQTALGGKYLRGCTLYVTVEPCTMCAGAIGWSQMSRIVIGTDDEKRGYTTFCAPGRSPFHVRARVDRGVLEEECAKLMRNFFRGLR
ncbi:MAG: nucleoside deaminase [Muribaculaceae bacterium]|nr:nucleoside deaminase [Muribaculaceae bacterium]